MIRLRLVVAAAVAAGALTSCGVHGSSLADASYTRVPTTPDSVRATATRIAHTDAGDVSYRSVGHGPVVLLITGYAATMDAWTPSFISALAQDHRVITLDNAGIGGTSALPQPLTVTAMANQTSALMAALQTGPATVVGWSMGGMIAQALAVEWPGKVSHLVLAGALPGNGLAKAPPRRVLQRLAAAVRHPALALKLLFPRGASKAAMTYVEAARSWPDLHGVTPEVARAQSYAVSRWFDGGDPAGVRVGAISAPTLIADGWSDVLVPQANVRALLAAIPHSRQVLYPHAGHAFLFQRQARFLADLARFID